MDSEPVSFEKYEELLQEVHFYKTKVNQLQLSLAENLALEKENNSLLEKYQNIQVDLNSAIVAREGSEKQVETLKFLLEKEQNELETVTRKLQEVVSSNQVSVTEIIKCDHEPVLLSYETRLQLLEKEVEALNRERDSLKEMNLELQKNYQSTACQLEEMTSMFEVKRDELISCKEVLEGLKEEKALLESELMQLKSPGVDFEQRGNSLFAEVEDKRKSTAKNLEIMQAKYNKLYQQYSKCQKELQKLKNENIELLLKASDEEVRPAESRLMQVYKTRIADLEEAVAVYSKRPESPIIQTVDFPDLPMVSAIVDRARSENESLRMQLLRKSYAESQQAFKTYMAERQVRLSEAALQEKEKDLQSLQNRLKELEENEKAFIKLKEQLKSDGKENESTALRKTKCVRFNSESLNEEKGDLNKPKKPKPPKVSNCPIIFIRNENVPVLKIKSEPQATMDSLKKDE